MSLKFNIGFAKKFVSENDIMKYKEKTEAVFNKINKDANNPKAMLGWKDLPKNYDKEEFAKIKETAARIRKECDVFLVIGIGGSYLGARAAIDFVRSNNYNLIKNKNEPEIYFTGNTISEAAISELYEICKNKRVYINVISKSGTTTEPAIAFRIFKKLVEEQAKNDKGPEVNKRIFATTDSLHGKLREYADKEKYETFAIPENIGGRYSVLTAVGLLPIAVAGIDIDNIMAGAEDAMNELSVFDMKQNSACRYAAVRNMMYELDNKVIEILTVYEPSLTMIAEWWKQLFGESEGKDKKGIFPVSVVNTTDLHSLGQIVQDGKRNIFETTLRVIQSKVDHLTIEPIEGDPDGLNYLKGKTIHEINDVAFKATAQAHSDIGNVPCYVLDLKKRSAYEFGYMVYFFELSCAISGYILGVNPFDQPGVEEYKKNMFQMLGKPE